MFIESRKRKQKNWEADDFYDSDEDTFLDRTGTIEKKRFMRMKKAGKDEAETYESLVRRFFLLQCFFLQKTWVEIVKDFYISNIF